MRYFSYTGCLFLLFVQTGCSTERHAHGSNAPRETIGFEKVEYFKSDFGSFITFIGVDQYDEDPEEDILVLSGRKGVLLALSDQRMKRMISLKAGFRPVAVSSQKSFLVLATGGGYSNIGLIDHDGKYLWKHIPSGELPANQMLGGDLNRDGIVELYVAGRRGLHRLDLKGGQLWTFGNHQYTGLGLLRDQEHKSGSIIAKNPDANNGGDFEIVDLNGKMIKRVKSPAKGIISFQVCHWPSTENILAYSGSVIYVVNLKGDVLFKHDLGEQIFAIAGTGVKLLAQKPKCLAILAKLRSSTRQSTLLIFSSKGILLHEELLSVSLGINSIRSKDAGSEQLLVGDAQRTVWLYKAKSSDSSDIKK